MSPDSLALASPLPQRRSRQAALSGSVLGLLLVVLAAAGAHLLPESAPDRYELWQTAQFMHLLHALALLFVSRSLHLSLSSLLVTSAVCFTVGTVLFSGSLYLRAAWPLSALVSALPGSVAPLGGGLLIVGWLSLVGYFLQALLKPKSLP